MKINVLVRNIVLVTLTFLLAFLSVIQLMRIQLMDGDYYASKRESYHEAEQSVPAARGQISDVNGTLLVTNTIVYQVIVQYAFFPIGRENEIIAKTINILEKNGEEWNDSIPLSKEAPFVFTTDDDEVLDAFRSELKLNFDATADNCMKALIGQYEIDTEKNDERMTRLIAGVRCEMTRKDFSYLNRFVFADRVSIDTVRDLKEQGFTIPGIDILETSDRSYLRSGTAPHVIGTIGPISSDEYKATKDKNGNTIYTINDIYGKGGIELGMERTLKGIDGTRTIVRSGRGEIISDDITTPASPGNSLKLTIDADFQDTLQTILENQINWLHYYNDPVRGAECDAGAVVVLNAKTGAVLGMASYPTFDLNDYVEDPVAVMSGENGASMFNLATQGLYRPGSAFKTINAVAGLCEGEITATSTITCNHRYTYFADYQPSCTGTHGSITVPWGLKYSCNVFFFELGRRLGIDRLASYASLFGYGEDLGLEIPCVVSEMTTPELYEKNHVGTTDPYWTPGNVLQAAIGQCETRVTPLNLAVQALTLANNGTRLRPYLVDSVWSYDYSRLISKTEPQVASRVDDRGTNAFETVRQGMIMVSENCTWPIYGGTNLVFDFLPDDVAIKTGTPEIGGGKYNSTVMGYYPAHDPQIAFGIVLEKADFSRYMIRNIIDAYFYDCYEPDLDEEGNVVSPWKRWTDTNKTPVR